LFATLRAIYKKKEVKKFCQSFNGFFSSLANRIKDCL
jgi:hypothetical protein